MNSVGQASAEMDASYYRIIRLDEKDRLNEAIRKEFEICSRTPDRQSHFFHGRYENTYIQASRMPSVERLLALATQHAATILGMPARELKCGFWFNVMQPGDVTTWHSHDEEDELLSCVYYIHVPEGSAELVLLLEKGEKYVTPEENMFVFFSPRMEHAVGRHEGKQPRLSLAINFGPA
ncbi:2OG-Fe(II) oxygenase family protein [Thiolapillus brandeum]|uniref:2OG-Fe(II) oxygenase n=1 Tax=Thiolapillus brandeum TaxID=1076588 RepID=A0A7U6GKD7_9GAMM|nr:hypothetical protein [Thiolapillus brandeum]BAO45215.1 hypothetical protein TBH_C2304 [Thiolapillus brandeum]